MIELRFLGMSGRDDFFRDGVFKIKTKFRFPRSFVWTMTEKAAVRQDRQHVAVKADLALSQSDVW